MNGIILFFSSMQIWKIALIVLAAIIVIVSVTAIVRNLKKRRRLKNIVNLAGFKYDPKQKIFYSEMDAWQRKFGYCRLYDEAAPALNMIIDSEPVRFRYNGKNWLIEFWKGQYGMTTGAEVGIYYTRRHIGKSQKAQDKAMYKCVKDKDMMPISCRLIKNNQSKFLREEKHWWLTGFVLGEFSEPEQLSAQIGITFPETGMLDAFVEALMKLGYLYNNFAVNGNTVWIVYTKPFNPKPVSRTEKHDKEVQKTNKALCDAYKKLTKGIDNDYDKLEACKKADPELYRSIVKFGQIPSLFFTGKLIKSGKKSKDADAL